MSAPPPPPVLVVCCGNPAAGDDALGALVFEALRTGPSPEGVEIIDLGANPAALCNHIEGRAALVIVDGIADVSRRPGELIDLPWADVRGALSLRSSAHPSTHALGPADQIALAAQLGLLPPVVRIIGLTIERAQAGEPPSAALCDRLRTLVDHVRATAMRLASAARPPQQR